MKPYPGQIRVEQSEEIGEDETGTAYACNVYAQYNPDGTYIPVEYLEKLRKAMETKLFTYFRTIDAEAIVREVFDGK